MLDFAGHIHAHRDTSPLDGTGTPNQYAARAVELEQDHLNCTDHGRLGGVLEHIHVCRNPEKHDDPANPGEKRSKHDRIIPLVGMEAFWRDDRFDASGTWGNKASQAHHLCFTASGLEGWRSLMRLSSQSWVRTENGGGFWGKPCVDWDLYERNAAGLIVSSACVSSPLSWLILQGDESGARKWVKRVQKISRGNLWLEIMPHDFDNQRDLNIGLVNLSVDTGAPLVATGDVHTPYQKWSEAGPKPKKQPSTHSVVRMMSYRQTLNSAAKKADSGEDTYTEEINSVYLSSGAEMLGMFEEHHPDLPLTIVKEAINNTRAFVRSARSWVVGRANKLPKVEFDVEPILRAWCEEGFKHLWESYPADHWEKYPMQVYRDRYDYEFSVLKGKEALDFFFIMADIVRWAKSTNGLPKLDTKGRIVRDARGNIIYRSKKKPIRVGLGRGSAAGCLVSYLIGITAIDPISWGLLFERFLNPDRVGLPDIDVDFQTGEAGRELVKEYMRCMYGRDHVADIIAYQTFAPRAVLKAVATVFEVDWKEIEEATESIGETERNLAKIASANDIVKRFLEKHEMVAEHAFRLEDQTIRDTRHASAVILTREPVTHYMPTQLGADEKTIVTAWADKADFPVCADYGFPKFDILGVRDLDKQQLCVEYVKRYYDKEIEPNEFPVLRDPYAVEQDVLDGFVHGLTVGIFQFGGRGITQLLRSIKPDNALDIAVANALFRPGPIDIAFEYADRKHGKVPVTYWHDAVEPVLRETLGLMCFQEQAMEVSKQIGNFTPAQADDLRKAMSKLYRIPGDKAQEFMQQYHEQWMRGTAENGIEEEAAEDIWSSKMLPLGNYLFNKSHAGSYGLQAVQDMTLKIRYPLPFYAATLTIEKKSKRKEKEDFLRRVMREARLFDIMTLPPDINTSETAWTVDERGLRYGLVSINDMGAVDGDQLVAEREKNGRFEGYFNFVDRMGSKYPANRSVALVKGGAFDMTDDRSFLLSKTEKWAGKDKYDIILVCGCKKTRTLPQGVDVDEALDDDKNMECKRHKIAERKEVKKLDPYYTVAQWINDHPDESTLMMEGQLLPTRDELLEMEKDALNVPISTGNTLMEYHDFIAERIYSEAEIEELPCKPKREGRKHGSRCACDACNASMCVVGGEVTGVKEIRTKSEKKEKMAFVDLVFGVNNYNLTAFPYIYREYHELLDKHTALLVVCHKTARGLTIDHVDDVVEIAEEAGWKPKVLRLAKHTPVMRSKVKAKPKIRKVLSA